MSRELSGKLVARALGDELGERVAALRNRGIVPKLAIVRVGNRDDDTAYERNARTRCEKLGIKLALHHLQASVTQAQMMECIAAINGDARVHACLLLRPLPTSLDEEAVTSGLQVDKDVDGVTPGSLYGVMANRAYGFPPCTAEAVIRILDHYAIPLEGARICMVGRSLVVGKPLSLMLQARHGTVTMCHTRTRDLAAECARADILVVAAGHPHTIGKNAVRPGQVVIDVGINWDEKAGRLVGDVDYEAVAPIVSALTPVPGGVGAVTTAVLAEHVVRAAERTMDL